MSFLKKITILTYLRVDFDGDKPKIYTGAWIWSCPVAFTPIVGSRTDVLLWELMFTDRYLLVFVISNSHILFPAINTTHTCPVDSNQEDTKRSSRQHGVADIALCHTQHLSYSNFRANTTSFTYFQRSIFM